MATEEQVRGSLEGILIPGAMRSLVSMNLFGFTPWIFPIARKRFEQFLKGLAADELKAEYVLPTMVDQLMHDEGLSVDVLKTDATWFGVTYREDKPLVTEALAKLHASDEYPTPLWK